jgi:hypothetical protein
MHTALTRYRPSTNVFRTALLVACAAVCFVLVWAPAQAAGGKTVTLRYFVKEVSTTLTKADGTVVRPPFAQPGAGDTLQINSVDYKGNHRRHARRWTASQVQRCVFVAQGDAKCQITVAIRGSLLFFDGMPSTVVNGTGRFQGASGRVLSFRDVKGGGDVTARIRLRRGVR